MFFTINPKEYETAYYFPIKGDRVKKHAIGVERVQPREKRWNTIAQNLIVDEGSMVLKTSYAYDYKDSREIQYRGKYYIIQKVVVDTRPINPQALAFANAEDNALRYLSLIEVQ